MPSFEVMSGALEFMFDKHGNKVVINNGEYSALPVFANVCKQLVQLSKAKSPTEFNLVFREGKLYNGDIFVGCGEEGLSENEFFQKVCAIQMWFLNPWRSLDFFSLKHEASSKALCIWTSSEGSVPCTRL
jgi:hypothetical protein